MPRTITYTVGILRGRSDAFHVAVGRSPAGWEGGRVGRTGGHLSTFTAYGRETRQRTRGRPIPRPPTQRQLTFSDHPPGRDEPAKPKNQTAKARAATPTETIITRSSTPPRRLTVRSPRIERVQPGR